MAVPAGVKLLPGSCLMNVLLRGQAVRRLLQRQKGREKKGVHDEYGSDYETAVDH